MKRKTGIILLFLTLSFLLIAQEDVNIQEEVVVRWWIVPFFAIHKNGEPVLDITEDSLEIVLSKKKITGFTLYKKELAISEEIVEEKIKKRMKPSDKEQVIFLVFDTVLSDPSIIVRSKVIAKEIVTASGSSSRFVVLSIDPYKGLRYIVGPTNEKDNILESIKKRIVIKKKKKSRHGNFNIDHNDISYHPGAGFSDAISGNRTVGRTGRQKISARSFISSLHTLNTALNTFKGSGKMVYIFSGGIKKEAMYRRKKTSYQVENPEKMFTPDTAMFTYLRNIGEVFNKNGSMLFLINPGGTGNHNKDPESELDLNSGEMSLRYLASESGGRYFEGTQKTISKTIVSMNRAYYHVAFPDSDDFTGKTHNIEIKSKNPDIKVYSVKKISRGKDYLEMEPIEKELLVLNAIEKGYWAKSKLKLIPGKLKTKTKKNKIIVYRLELLQNFQRKELDVFKVWINEKEKDSKIEKERITTGKDAVNVEVQVRKLKKYKHFIVIIEGISNTALITETR